jgi:two-component system, NtrC family, nitrogen regulation sensor histidine kinase NtrY
MYIFKNFQWRIGFRVILLLVSLTAAAFFAVKMYWVFLLVLMPFIVYLVIEFCRFHYKSYEEISQFVESIHYRDFSRNFDVKHAPSELKPLRKGFNEINSTFKIISKEKETQYQYLQKILELVDTGILSYKEKDGGVVWMNETLKRLLQLPYLKTIHSLAKRDAVLYKQIIALRPGETKIASAHLERTSFKMLLSSTAFQTEGEKFILIAFQNIDEALDETESKAWQKLLSVMTHEIMNSIAPISSLADTLKCRLKSSIEKLDNSDGSVDDLELGIETIKRRSEGLLKFAETYRNLNRISTLNIQKIFIRDLFENLYQLMQPTLNQKQIEMEIVLKDTDLALEADTNLVEQVLINLVVNSIDAVKESKHPRIVLSAFYASGNKVVIKVSDNGSGMPEEVLEKIFIPFFSTKKSGSGIGLSLCKQIMMLHKGNIHIKSIEENGTTVSLHF